MLGTLATAVRDSRVAAERFVSWVRLAIASSMAVVVAFQDRDAVPYPGRPGSCWPLAIVYAWLAFLKTTRDARRGETNLWTAWVLSALSGIFVAAAAAVTGAGHSPIIPVAITVVISTAIRFDLARSLAVAVAMAASLAAAILWVPEPALPWHERVRDAAWWSWLMIAVALLVGVLSRAADLARQARAEAEAEAEAEHRRLDEEHRLRLHLEGVDQARRDFLHALAHDFRTPISSIEALSTALARRSADLEPAGAGRAGRAHRTATPGTCRPCSARCGRWPCGSRSAPTGGWNWPTSTSPTSCSRRGRRRARADGSCRRRRRLTCSAPTARRRCGSSPTCWRTPTSTRRPTPRRGEPGGATGRWSCRCSTGARACRRVRPPGVREVGVFGPHRSTGLGMWIVAQLVESLQGTVWAEPRPGGGLAVRAASPGTDDVGAHGLKQRGVGAAPPPPSRRYRRRSARQSAPLPPHPSHCRRQVLVIRREGSFLPKCTFFSIRTNGARYRTSGLYLMRWGWSASAPRRFFRSAS